MSHIIVLSIQLLNLSVALHQSHTIVVVTFLKLFVLRGKRESIRKNVTTCIFTE